MEGSRFPLELCESVIEYSSEIYPSETEAGPMHTNVITQIQSTSRTLLACALTCKAWLPKALQCLYRGVIIAYDSSDYRFHTYSSRPLMKSDGPLPLRLLFNQDGWLILPPPDPSVVDRAGKEEIPAITTFLPELRHHDNDHLQLPLGTDSDIYRRDHSPISWRTSLCIRAIHELHLYVVAFRNVFDFGRLLTSIPSLRHLHLFEIDIGCYVDDIPSQLGSFEDQTPSGTVSDRRLRLQTLKCHMDPEVLQTVLEWLLGSLSFEASLQVLFLDDLETERLDDIDADIYSSIAGSIRDIVFSSGNALQSIELGGTLGDPLAVNFSRNSALRSFKLPHAKASVMANILNTIISSRFSTLHTARLGVAYPDDPKAVVEALISLARRSSLRNLTVDFNLDEDEIVDEIGEERDDMYGRCRDEMVAGKARLTELLGDDIKISGQ